MSQADEGEDVVLGVPIDLLLRALRTNDADSNVTDLALLLRHRDELRVRDAGTAREGDNASPKLVFDIELLAKRRMGDARGEGEGEGDGEFVVQLLRAVHWDAGDDERRFVVELVRRLGPGGPLAAIFKDSYLEIAAALAELREKRGGVDVGLVLYEPHWALENVPLLGTSKRTSPSVVMNVGACSVRPSA